MNLIILARDNIEIARAEVLSLYSGNFDKDTENIFLTKNKDNFERLAYAKSVYKLLFHCNENNLEKKIKLYKWQLKDYRIDFSGRFIDEQKKSIQSTVYKSSQSKVSLKSPETKIVFIKSGNTIYCTQYAKEINNDFESRKAHKRPGFSPISLSPKLARAMVNLTGAKKDSTILDPFCGTGGILIEAGLVGMKCEGCDLSDIMIAKAAQNLSYFGINKCSLEKRDALTISACDYVVSDLPYGRNTRITKFLYRDFLLVLGNTLEKKAVLGFPSSVDIENLIKGTGLKIEQSFTYYIHKSLSKRIVVIGRG